MSALQAMAVMVYVEAEKQMVVVDVANMPRPARGCHIVIRGTITKVLVDTGVDSNF